MYLKNSFQIMGDFKHPYHTFMAHSDLPFAIPNKSRIKPLDT